MAWYRREKNPPYTFFIKSKHFLQTKHLGSFKETDWTLRLHTVKKTNVVEVEIFRNIASAKKKLQSVLVVLSLFHPNIPEERYMHQFFTYEKSVLISLLPDFSTALKDNQTVRGTFSVNENISEALSSSVTTTNLVIPDSSNRKPCVSKASLKRFTIFHESKSSPSSKISEDIYCLLNNPDSFPDATLKCGTSDIKVHRCILSARSPVFAAMFKNQMQERLSGTIKIVDMASDVLHAMLKYIYSGKTDHLHEALVRDLIYAADKYELEELKTSCVDILILSMAVSNVLERLVFGDMHDGRLKNHAKGFICKCKKISEVGKEKWELLQAERPALAMEVLMSVVEYIQEK